MPPRRTCKTTSLLAKSAELAFAVPQVVAHRVTRMALAGPAVSARDRKEFQRMGAEKAAAFGESWQAMTLQAMRANQALALSFARSFWSASPRGMLDSGRAVAQLQGAALGVLGKGMAPVHRKAVANAKRLARTRLR